MKKLLALVLIIITGGCLFAEEWKDSSTGILWQYAMLPAGKVKIGFDLGGSAIASSYSGNLTIPSEIKGYQVVSIGERAFSYHYYLRSVALPWVITVIPNRAFDNCLSLLQVDLANIEYIAERAFFNCYNLKSPAFSSALKSIAKEAFGGCTGIKTVTLPDSLQLIGSGAFENCTMLQTITLSDKIGGIGENAFSGCTNLSVVYVKPDSDVNKVKSLLAASGFDVSAVEFVSLKRQYCVRFDEYVRYYFEGDLLGDMPLPSKENYSFVGWSHKGTIVSPQTEVASDMTLEAVWRISSDIFSINNGKLVKYVGLQGDISIPEGVKEISDSVFAGCSKLTSVVMPSSVTKIGYRAFKDCTSLSRVTMSSNVTIISDCAFQNCTALTTVALPTNSVAVEGGAFKGCAALTKIIMPQGVRIASTPGFRGCTSLRSVVIPGGFNMRKVFFDSYQLITNVEVCVGATNCPLFSECRKLETVTLPDGIDKIQDSAFWECENLLAIELPDSVRSIGDSAFYDCTKLISVRLSQNITNIGNNAFYGCRSIKDLVVPSCVDKISDVFSGSGGTIESVEIGNGKLECGSKMFTCKNLTKVLLPPSMKCIRKNAFYDCVKLETVVIPPGVETIEEEAFKGCSELRSVTMPPCVKMAKAFPDAYKLVNHLIVSSETSNMVDQFANGCNALKSIVLLSGMRYISKEAFSYCRSLDVVDIPFGVTNIDSEAFSWCSALTEIKLPESVVDIGSRAFLGCSTVTNLVIPSSVTNIGSSAFYHLQNTAIEFDLILVLWAFMPVGVH